MTQFPPTLVSLMAHLKKLPGVGRKTAERFAFHLLDWKQMECHEFADLIKEAKKKILPCPTCGCLTEHHSCLYCDPIKRDPKTLCIVSSPKDVYLFEETKSYTGHYHVLGALLSPLEGKNPEDLQLDKLIRRLEMQKTHEVIIALDATLEGDTTALFLKEKLSKFSLKLSRIAFGLPIGSTLDYIDGTTLSQAICGRQTY
jgi:recombination protein RecR